MRDSCMEYPSLDYFYFADYKFLPYGDKPAEVLRAHLLQTIIDLYNRFAFDTVVLACNTATTIAINFLRQNLPDITFVGTEPAVSLAVKNGYKNILVLATENTIKHNITIKKYSLNPDISLYLQPMKNLAQSIEINISNLDTCMSQITPVLSEFRGKIDCVVLGCTHYSLLKNKMIEYFGISVLDGNNGVVRHLGGMIENGKKRGRVTLLTNDNKKINKLKNAWLRLCNKEGQICVE